MERWMAPTLKSVRGLARNESVKCGCGRVTNADMLRFVPTGLRDRFGGREFVCDACFGRAIRTKRCTRSEYLRQIPAPDSVLARLATQP